LKLVRFVKLIKPEEKTHALVNSEKIKLISPFSLFNVSETSARKTRA